MKALLALITLFLISCTTVQLPTTYYLSQPLLYHKLNLRQDSTFQYIITSDVGTDTTNGRFLINSDTLVLSSYENYIPYKVSEGIRGNSDSIYIYINDISGMNYSVQKLILNDSVPVTIQDNLAIISKNAAPIVESIFISGIPGEYTYKTNGNKSNHFKISYNVFSKHSFYLVNKEFIIRNNRIVDPNKNVIMKKD